MKKYRVILYSVKDNAICELGRDYTLKKAKNEVNELRKGKLPAFYQPQSK